MKDILKMTSEERIAYLKSLSIDELKKLALHYQNDAVALFKEHGEEKLMALLSESQREKISELRQTNVIQLMIRFAQATKDELVEFISLGCEVNEKC